MIGIPRTAMLLGIIGLLQATTVFTAPDSALAQYSFGKKSLTQWKLPGRLREISGLALRDGRLFGHNDQFGIVYEIDYRDGRLIKAFALGKKTVRADFEGIAAVGNSFYLVTSDGRLYVAREGDNGERVPFETFSTGLGRRCEIEGLAHDAARKRLLLACKQPRNDKLKKRIAIFAWSLERKQIIENETILVKGSKIIDKIPSKYFNPSGIEIDTRTGHLLLVAARQRAIAEIDLDGKVIAAFRLPSAKRHRQVEGIALTADGHLILADEGSSKKARLAIYRPEN